ncbi:MAG: peptidase E [Oscillospiraceae bacterium]|nr:peptidase E [Oscillospiraceae bacterium]
MSRLLGLFSGFPRGFPPEVAAFLREHLTQHESLAFVASNVANHAKTDHYAATLNDYFAKAGVHFSRYHMLDGRISFAHAVQLATETDCVFLMGGNPATQIQYLRESGLAQAIAGTHAAVFGLSAGAINMAKTAFDDTQSPSTYAGLGLADITIHPHFDPQKQDELAAIRQVSAKRPIYAMKDESAIFVQNEQNTFMGEIIKFQQ